MIEHSELAAVSDVAIARQLERLERVDYALGQTHRPDGRTTSDFGSEDGQIIYTMSTDLVDLTDRTAHPLYNIGVLYAMQIDTPLAAVQKLPRVIPPKNNADTSNHLQHLLELDGLERVGDIFVPRPDNEKVVVPTLGALAARYFVVAAPRIKSMQAFVDTANEVGVELTETNLRKLAKNNSLILEFYKRHAAIKAAKLAIHEAALPRDITIGRHAISVFSDWQSKPDESSWNDTSWWWNELEVDLGAIDEAASKLNG